MIAGADDPAKRDVGMLTEASAFESRPVRRKPLMKRGFLMPFFVYILRSVKSGRYYIGQTHDLEDRLRRHNSGTELATAQK